METQINDLVNGSPFVSGTNQDMRNKRGEQVLAENGDTITLQFSTERGSFEKTLKRHTSTTGKSWQYGSVTISDEEAAILGYDMSVYVCQHTVDIYLTSDMRCVVSFYARKTETFQWKWRGDRCVNNAIISIK